MTDKIARIMVPVTAKNSMAFAAPSLVNVTPLQAVRITPDNVRRTGFFGSPVRPG